MSYPPQPPQGQNAHQNDPRIYQARTVTPPVRIETVRSAPTLGQYIRSDYRGMPGAKKRRWAGLVAFWFGMLTIPMLWVLGTIAELHVFAFVAAGISVVAIFFGLVAFIAGIGRVLGFFGIVFALIGNIYVISWLDTVLNPQ